MASTSASTSSSTTASHKLPNIPFFKIAHDAALKSPQKPAIIDQRTGNHHTYADLLRDALAFRSQIARDGEHDLQEARVAALIPKGCECKDVP